MIRAVLFDAVGTVIQLREPVGETYARFARAHGVAAPPAALQAAFPRALRAMPPMVFPGLTAAEVREAERRWWRRVVWSVFNAAGAIARFADFEPCFGEIFAHFAGVGAWRCADGAGELLRTLRARGLRTGIVSNFDHRLPALLGALGLAPLLDAVVLPGDAGAAKPDPGIFALALERLAMRAAEAVYVGDDADDDIAGARRAGLRAIDVNAVGGLERIAGLLD